MDVKTCRRTTGARIKGTRFRLNPPVESQDAVIPRGTVVTVLRKYKGFTVLAEPCRDCGVQVKAVRVEPRCLDGLPASCRSAGEGRENGSDRHAPRWGRVLRPVRRVERAAR